MSRQPTFVSREKLLELIEFFGSPLEETLPTALRQARTITRVSESSPFSRQTLSRVYMKLGLSLRRWCKNGLHQFESPAMSVCIDCVSTEPPYSSEPTSGYNRNGDFVDYGPREEPIPIKHTHKSILNESCPHCRESRSFQLFDRDEYSCFYCGHVISVNPVESRPVFNFRS